MNNMDLFFVYLELNSVDKNGSDLKSILSCLVHFKVFIDQLQKFINGGDISIFLIFFPGM